jgi:MFS family permease
VVRHVSSFDDEKDASAMSRMNTHESHGPAVERFDTGMSQMELIDQESLGRVKSHEKLVTPAATLDPRDPLNLSKKRKIIAVVFLCFFGAMAAAAELILGAMLPVFVIEYAGLDSRNIEAFTRVPLPEGTNPLSLLSYLPGPPIWKTYLLGSLPVLMIGLANLAMIPLATAVGRRPVIIGCGVLAVAGCVWSGNSQSLDSHLAARCLQAVGAGTVESLIPFVIADLTFSHERNTWMSFVFATQGLIIVALGFATPWVIINLSWRWLYFITGIGASVFMVGVLAFLPETRWKRTASEIRKCRACRSGI